MSTLSSRTRLPAVLDGSSGIVALLGVSDWLGKLCQSDSQSQVLSVKKVAKNN
jgi:hypothetical protein